MPRTFTVSDLFCGAGGSSTGAMQAIEALGAEMDLLAVNHWETAIATHSRNHPKARHVCTNIDDAQPWELVPEGRLDLLMASPECIWFSRARGGKPVNNQRRMGAYRVHEWAAQLDIRCILVENVPEFREWGPLDPDTGKPVKKLKGTIFLNWVQGLRGLGYEVDWRLLNSADYGDATTRTRLFIQARKDGIPIQWPEPSHARAPRRDMFGSALNRWRPAREIIDWSKPGQSLFDRKRPLSVKTRARIARGLEKYGGPLAPHYIALLDLPEWLSDGSGTTDRTAEPFVSAQRQHTAARSTGEPLPTITAGAGSGGMALVEPAVEPFILGQQSGSAARDTGEPLPTIAAAGAISLSQPVLIPYYRTGVPNSVDAPLGTVTTRDRFALATPTVVPYGPKAEARTVEEPLPTVLTKDRLGVATPLMEPFILSRHGDFDGATHPRASAMDEPIPTLTARGGGYLVDPFLVPQFGERDGQAPRVHVVEKPLPAVTSHGAGALVEPALVTVNHGGHDDRSHSVHEPLPTVTAKRGVGLVEPVMLPAEAVNIDPRRLVFIDGVLYVLDIRFRMLTNHELRAAMGFPDDYEFDGNVGDVTRQIGNAVSVRVARALVAAMLGPVIDQEQVEQPDDGAAA